jgi:hypothetical protein
MKRKLISQRDSYTLTLPIKWIREHGLDKKGEVDIEEEKEGLFIKSLAIPKKSTEITIDSSNKKFVAYILNNLYRSGYDSVRINFKEKGIVKLVEEQIKLLLGWQIIEKKENNILIDNLTEPTTEKFDVLFRRIFFIIKTDLDILEDSLKGIKLDIEEIEKGANEVVTLDNFCRRCISKRIVEKEKINFYWHFVSTLTWVHREIYSLLNYLSRKKIKNKELLALTEKISKAFDFLHEGFFEKNFKKIESVFNITEEIQNQEEKLLKVCKNTLVYHKLLQISRMINLLCSPCIGILT